MEYLRHIAYDSVVFGFEKRNLKILLIRYHQTNLYALPGGFVRKDESLDEAAIKGLKERTGLKNVFLEQFHTFGSISRFKPEVMQTIIQSNGLDPKQFEWFLDRFISVAYFALIDHTKVKLEPDSLSDSCMWYDLRTLPPLMLDHKEIINKALETLQERLNRSPAVLRHLLPKKFTMKELQEAHETILGEKLHRGTFQRKMLASGDLIRHEKQYTGAANKAPFLYEFGG